MTTPERPAVSCVGGPADRHRLVGASALLGAFLIGMGVAGAAAGAGDERAGVGAPPHPRVRWRNDRASELKAVLFDDG